MSDSVKTKDVTTAPAKDGSFLSRFFSRNGYGKAPEPPPPQVGPPKTVVREYFESLVVTVIMALFGMTFIVQAVKVPTGSMQNTITVGDHLLVNKFVFAPGTSFPLLPQREINRGDIIVFKYPGNKYDPSRDERPENRPIVTNYVKRVIGIPGDRIRIEGRDIIVNGQALPEHRIEAKEISEKAPLVPVNNPPRQADAQYNVFWRPDFEGEQYEVFKHEGQNGEIVVPQGNYFVMGDNRNNSEDSRWWGFVPRDLVIGRAMFVYWSFDESAPDNGNFLINFFANTRWRRTGTMVK